MAILERHRLQLNVGMTTCNQDAMPIVIYLHLFKITPIIFHGLHNARISDFFLSSCHLASPSALLLTGCTVVALIKSLLLQHLFKQNFLNWISWSQQSLSICNWKVTAFSLNSEPWHWTALAACVTTRPCYTIKHKPAQADEMAS